MIAVIDNYDSFTYNLVQYLGELVQTTPVHGQMHAEIRVWRNDEIDVEELAELHPTHIVISPGPGSPEKDSGVSNDVIRVLGQTTPILGVCLGQQCMGYVFGGDPALLGIRFVFPATPERAGSHGLRIESWANDPRSLFLEIVSTYGPVRADGALVQVEENIHASYRFLTEPAMRFVAGL